MVVVSERHLTFKVLGPLSVTSDDGEDVRVAGNRRRTLLLRLLLAAGAVVTVERLADDVWDGRPPAGAASTLQSHVSLLRGILGPSRIRFAHDGYAFSAGDSTVDARSFEEGVVAGRGLVAGGHLDRAERLLRRCLGLWRGSAFSDVIDRSWAMGDRVRLEEMRSGAFEEWLEVRLALGEEHGVIGDAEAALVASPLREGLWETLMLALYRSGRQADALRAFRRLEETLGEQLGVDPGPSARALERAILVNDPVLVDVVGPFSGITLATGTVGDVRRDEGRPEAAGRHGVPSILTEYVPREELLADVVAAAGRNRLTTLFGPGGTGKTRLAVEAAIRLDPVFPGGVWWVDLAAVADGALIAGAVVAALDPLRGDPGTAAGTLADRVGSEATLMVFDNCEHVVESACRLAGDLLTERPNLRILATSRHVLGLAGEALLPIPPMTLSSDVLPLDDDAVYRSEAVRLFVSRARLVNRGFAPQAAELRTVAEICRRLDGIPLAIELAAPAVGVVSPDELLSELARRRFQVATRTPRNVAHRQRTLEDAIAWSYELLSEEQRRLFVRLSVIVGDFPMEAAESIGAQPDGAAFFPSFARLVDASMIVVQREEGEVNRYRLLESLRDFGLTRLSGSDDEHDVRRRHAAHYTDFAESAQRMLHSQLSEGWSVRIGRELGNLRAAFAWAFSEGDLGTGIRLAASLNWVMGRMGDLDQARRWLADAALRADELTPAQYLQVLTASITVAFCDGDQSGAAALGERAVALAEDFGDGHELALAYMARGCTAVYAGDLALAADFLRRSYTCFLELKDRWGIAWTLTLKGITLRRSEDLEGAAEDLQRALDIFRSLRDVHGQVMPLTQLALLAQRLGDLVRASELAQQALGLARQLGDRQLSQLAVTTSGWIALLRGDLAEAHRALTDAVVSYGESPQKVSLAMALEGLATLSFALGDHEQAVALWSLSDDRRAAWQVPLVGVRLADRDRDLARARSRLTPSAFARAWASGPLLDPATAARLVHPGP